MRYVPSSERKTVWTWRRKATLWLALALAGIFGVISAWPFFHDDAAERRFFGETADFIWVGIALVVVVPIAVGLLLALFIMFLSYPATRLSWSTGEALSERLLVWLAKSLALGIPTLMVIIVVWGFLLFLSAPTAHDVKFVHLRLARIDESPLIGNLGLYSFKGRHAHLSGHYLAVDDNVISLASFPPVRLFSSPIDPVSDIHLRGDKLLVVTGRRLVQAAEDGSVEVLARLPLMNMRIGLIATHGGVATPLLLSGNDSSGGYVFELSGGMSYAEILRVDRTVNGAAGCLDRRAVALPDRVLLLRLGFRPRLLLRLPQGSPPITSILARIVPGNDPTCLWLVATKNAVFAAQDGVTTLLIAGLGGNLSAGGEHTAVDTDRDLDFDLTDSERNTAVRVSLASPMESER